MRVERQAGRREVKIGDIGPAARRDQHPLEDGLVLRRLIVGEAEPHAVAVR